MPLIVQGSPPQVEAAREDISKFLDSSAFFLNWPDYRYAILVRTCNGLEYVLPKTDSKGPFKVEHFYFHRGCKPKVVFIAWLGRFWTRRRFAFSLTLQRRPTGWFAVWTKRSSAAFYRAVAASNRVSRSKKTSTYHAGTKRPSPQTQQSLGLQANIRNGSVQTLTNLAYTSYKREWSGTVTPGFRSLRPRVLPINDHWVDIIEDNDLGWSFLSFDPDQPYEQFDLFPWFTRFGTAGAGGAPVYPSHLESARNKAIERLVQKMQSSSEGNLAVDLFYVNQTASMIARSATRIAKSLLALKRGRFKRAIDLLWRSNQDLGVRQGVRLKSGNSLANNWLELQYGWKPLLQDIHGSLNSLALFYNQGEFTIRSASASAKSELRTATPLTSTTGSKTVRIGASIEMRHTRVRYILRYKVEDRLRAFLAQTGFTNPLNLAWEVLPFSFVVDWFIPVGGWLQNLTSYQGLELVDGCVTQFTRQEILARTYFKGNEDVSKPNSFSVYEGGFGRSRVILNRGRILSFPYMSNPELKNPLSLTHALNALALMVSVFEGSRKR